MVAWFDTRPGGPLLTMTGSEDRHPEQAAQRACRRTHWPALLRAAAAMGISPAEFWRLSLTEWRALAGEGDAMSRGAFEALARRFPDEDR